MSDLRTTTRTVAYERLRANVGRTILPGPEVLIVADIVLTVAIDQTIERTCDGSRRSTGPPGAA